MRIRPGLVMACVGATVVVLAGACGSGSRPVSAASSGGRSDAAAYAAFRDAPDGFSVSVPSTWQRLDLTAPDVNATVDQMLAQNPEVAAQVGSAQNLIQAGVRFLAVAPGGATDANVVVRPAPVLAGGRIDSLLSGVTSSVAAAGGSVVAHPDLTVAGVAVLHITASLPVGGRAVTTEQFYLVRAGPLYVLTVRAPADVVAAVVASLRLSG